MISRRVATGVLFAGLLAGCMGKPKEEPIVTADATTILRVKDDLQRMDPSARVGQVSEVNADEMTAAVGNIDTDGLNEGDIITFLDGNEKPLTTGKIIRVIPGAAVHVKYVAPDAGSRAPVVGDLGVHFKPAGGAATIKK